jgi:hypothetical protein
MSTGIRITTRSLWEVPKDGFDNFRFVSEDAPVSFKRVVVHFGNGTDEELQFRQVIEAGGSTRAMDLRGRRRIIKSVEFWYENGERELDARPTVRLLRAIG